MKEVMSKWKNFLNENEENLLFGNCGMFAVALAEEAQKREIKNCGLVFVHNAETDAELVYGDYSLYHVAFFIGDKIYDGRGELEENELIDFDPNIPQDAYIDYFDLKNLDEIKSAIRRNTEWDSSCEYYKEKAKYFFDNM